MLYDSLLVAALLMVAAALVVIPAGAEVASGNIAFQLYLLAVWFLYFAVCWRSGQTLGMKAWRIDLVGSGRKPEWHRLAIRFLMAGVSLLAAGLGFAWSLLDSSRRTWHDLASGTRLVYRPRR
ncbi:MAG: RDD family protein [Gammaproteobacteria bacterium]|jgi:uncharacterized RDD family membrane protein YckC|nr:RDD family protein [Gammaproteobacteria bacterium]